MAKRRNDKTLCQYLTMASKPRDFLPALSACADPYSFVPPSLQIFHFPEMEINYDLSQIFPDQPIQRLDKSMLLRLNPRKFWAVQKVIDTMGERSTTVSFRMLYNQ